MGPPTIKIKEENHLIFWMVPGCYSSYVNVIQAAVFRRCTFKYIHTIYKRCRMSVALSCEAGLNQGM